MRSVLDAMSQRSRFHDRAHYRMRDLGASNGRWFDRIFADEHLVFEVAVRDGTNDQRESTTTTYQKSTLVDKGADFPDLRLAQCIALRCSVERWI